MGGYTTLIIIFRNPQNLFLIIKAPTLRLDLRFLTLTELCPDKSSRVYRGLSGGAPLGFRVLGFEFRVEIILGLGFSVYGVLSLGLRVLGFEFRCLS